MTSTHSDIMTAIAVERERQRKRYDAAHDDEHTTGELLIRAAELAICNTDTRLATDREPDAWGLVRKHGGDARHSLVVAAALIVAEIERLDREAAP